MKLNKTFGGGNKHLLLDGKTFQVTLMVINPGLDCSETPHAVLCRTRLVRRKSVFSRHGSYDDLNC